MEERMMDVIVEIYNHMEDSDKDAFTLEDAEDMVAVSYTHLTLPTTPYV